LSTQANISRTLRAVSPDGEELTVFVAVGAPYETKEGAWVAPVSVEPLEQKIPEVFGADSWQATKLAMDHSTFYLKRFIKNGGKLYFQDSDETEEPFTLEDIDEFF